MIIFFLQKIALHEINTSRYNEEFHEVCKLGDGEFGSVYKCIHRLDGCTYAIKKSKAPVAGSQYEYVASFSALLCCLEIEKLKYCIEVKVRSSGCP